VNSLNNQLRLELAPFNVKVISVIAGGFRSKFFDNNTGKSLPDGSLYAPAREEIQAAMRGDSLPDFLMGHERFAEEVVKNTLKRSPKVHCMYRVC
jgi:1-acylglycerone phosphate reductase